MQRLTSRAIQGMFFERLTQVVGAEWVDAISRLYQSDQDSEDYVFSGHSPTLREWTGERQAKELVIDEFNIKNKMFEATLVILKKWIDYDKTGHIEDRINEMVMRVAAHWDKLLSELIITGESATCYDGQFFFDTDHADSGSNQSNDIGIDISALPVNQNGSTTAPSPEEMEQCILQGIAQIGSFVDADSEPVNENLSKFLVMVPTTLKNAADAAVTNPVLTSGKTNTIANGDFEVKVVANQRLNSTWTAAFPIFATEGGQSPLVRQLRQDNIPDMQAEGSAEEFNNRRWLFGVTRECNVGFGDWKKACLVTMT